MKLNYFIGIDVSKNELDFAVMKDKKLLFHKEISNDPADIFSYIAELKTLTGFTMRKSVFCLEQTGIYGNHLINCLNKWKANIVVENALHIKNSLGLIRGKNDKLDAIRIAQYAFKNKDELKLWVPKRPVILQLAHLFTVRNRLRVVLDGLKTPLKEQTAFITAGIHVQSLELSKRSMDALKQDITDLDIAMQQVIGADERLKHLQALVTSVPFIGPVTAIQLIISTNEFLDIRDPKKFACYAGVAPFTKESGIAKSKARVSPIANKKVKALLHICAISALRGNNELKDYYQRKVKEGKPKMAVINAIRNKLILRIFACVNQDRCFEVGYEVSNTSLQNA